MRGPKGLPSATSRRQVSKLLSLIWSNSFILSPPKLLSVVLVSRSLKALQADRAPALRLCQQRRRKSVNSAHISSKFYHIASVNIIVVVFAAFRWLGRLARAAIEDGIGRGDGRRGA